MPTVGIPRDLLFEALGKTYSTRTRAQGNESMRAADRVHVWPRAVPALRKVLCVCKIHVCLACLARPAAAADVLMVTRSGGGVPGALL